MPLRCRVFHLAWAISLIFSFYPGRLGHAHHTSGISYVLQKVGMQTIGCFSVEMIATPPRLTETDEKNLSQKEKHKMLDRFTHRFQVVVRNESDARPLAGLEVRATFTGAEWENTFRLQPATENDTPIYAANVALGPRGKYQVRISLGNIPAASCRKIRPNQVLTVKLAFENDFETLKEVMQAMLRTLGGLGQAALTAGLDGELLPPRLEEKIRKLAARLREIVPWTVNLREGAAQEVFEDHAARLLEISEKIQASAAKGDMDELVHRIAAARSACVSCHEIFQEADATGTMPRVSGFGKAKMKSPPRR